VRHRFRRKNGCKEKRSLKNREPEKEREGDRPKGEWPVGKFRTEQRCHKADVKVEKGKEPNDVIRHIKKK